MEFEEEPMDVDVSGNSSRHIDAMDVSYNDLNHTPLEVKIKEEPLESCNEDINENNVDDKSQIARNQTLIKHFSLQRKYHKSLSVTTLSFIFTIISLATLLVYHIISFECSTDLDLEVLKESLSKNVIGQSKATEYIIESLKAKSSSKLLLIYGGTGVGKTLTISLILEKLHNYANIYHYTMPSFSDTFSADLMLGLTFCPTSMIIVDDLNSTDMHVKDNIKKIIKKSENLNKNITILLVFNCDIINEQYVKKCDDSFSTDLSKAFKDIDASKQLIKFNSLSEEHLRRCIEKELGDKNISDKEFTNILNNFNVSVDGCKGVYMKIKLLNIN